MLTIQDAVSDLYRLAVVEKLATSTKRLDVLAAFCIQELEARGLHGALPNQDVLGGGRTKSWDVAWRHAGKHRLAISLKSLLKNIPGTVPNRLDDLMGEAANAQLYSPEIVLGYLMIFNVTEDAVSDKHGKTWSELFRERLTGLSGRRPPAWTIGTVEGYVQIDVDFSQSAKIVNGTENLPSFFDFLAEQVKLRNPHVVTPKIVEPSGEPASSQILTESSPQPAPRKKGRSRGRSQTDQI